MTRSASNGGSYLAFPGFDSDPLTVRSLTLEPGSYVILGKIVVNNESPNTEAIAQCILSSQAAGTLDGSVVRLFASNAATSGTVGSMSFHGQISVTTGDTVSIKCWASIWPFAYGYGSSLIAIPAATLILQ
jgi:hypothetical protein